MKLKSRTKFLLRWLYSSNLVNHLMKPNGRQSFSLSKRALYAGSKLLGIVNEKNEVDILRDPLEVDAAFIESANKGKVAEQKFRFVNKCVKSGCSQWTGSACSVIQRVPDTMEGSILKDELPACSIRPSCRWFAQEGPEACKVCPLVKYIQV